MRASSISRSRSGAGYRTHASYKTVKVAKLVAHIELFRLFYELIKDLLALPIDLVFVAHERSWISRKWPNRLR